MFRCSGECCDGLRETEQYIHAEFTFLTQVEIFEEVSRVLISMKIIDYFCEL